MLLFVLIIGVSIVNRHVSQQRLESAARWDRVFAYGFLAGTFVVYGALTVWCLWT